MKTPLVHCITNYVTVQDVANMILACGGSPVMADDSLEVEQITAASDALVLNLGTLQQRTVASMQIAGQTANQKKIPVVFDPVGIGASEFRSRTALRILERTDVAVIRGNYAEISFLAGREAKGRGVDSIQQENTIITTATDTTAITTEMAATVATAQFVAARYHCLVVITGATDVITDRERTVFISNGVPQMSQITGTGCMLSGMLGVSLGANQDWFHAAVNAVASMGIAGELSWEKNQTAGLGSFRVGLFDAISKMDDTMIAQRGKICEIQEICESKEKL